RSADRARDPRLLESTGRRRERPRLRRTRQRHGLTRDRARRAYVRWPARRTQRSRRARTGSARRRYDARIAAYAARGRRTIVTVTKRACLWCGRKFTVSGGPGRPRVYCKPSCKQRDYESRRRTEELGLSEHELVITRQELDTM